jgi:S-methylmethionine-dependent homocysteine/selenocysteine methylase
VHEVLLLDGGTGQELLRRADAAPTPLWSAQVMIDQPDLVVDVHRAFLAAGADVLTVNAYSATRCRLGRFGRADDYERLQRLACELAVTARDDRADVLVAGCLSPYGWSYRPELAPPYDELWPLYAETAALQAPHVDVVLCETMGSIDEARAAVRGARAADRPIWLAWALRADESACLHSGEPLSDALGAIESSPVDAVFVNCSTPEAVTAAIPTLAASGRRFGAYANGFGRIADDFTPGSVATILPPRDDLDPVAYADAVDVWIDAGATVVGGCCEIGPDHIAELSRRLVARRGGPRIS